MGKKKKDDGFIDDVPEMIENLSTFKTLSMTHPAIPFPWPPYVLHPEQLDSALTYLQKVFDEREVKEARTGGKLGMARKFAKTCFCGLARHVAEVLAGENYLEQWPTFDRERNPGVDRRRIPFPPVPPLPKEDEPF